MNCETQHLHRCRELIETKLGWGNSEHWQNSDFSVLSEQIFEETKVKLSVSTLKRIWGKIRHEGSPNMATLNTLAEFAGFTGWRSFTSTLNTTTGEPSIPKAVSEPLQAEPQVITSQPFRFNRVLAVSCIVVLVMTSVAIALSFKKSNGLVYNNITFSSRPVTSGVPNTVIFQYDASNSNADSVFIQQNWDATRRFKVDKARHEFTSTYFFPGYFRAKLILDDSVVKEHDLYIESDGWLRTIDKGSIPIYLSVDEPTGGALSITTADLINEKVDLANEVPWTSLFYVHRNLSMASTNFTFETDLKNTFGEGEGVCKKTEIFLLGSNGVYIIPLSIEGCVGELRLVTGRQVYDGRISDLSAFGVDFSNWAKIQLTTGDNGTTILINDRVAFNNPAVHDIGKIVGIRIRFLGTGEIRTIKLRNKEKKSIELL